MSALPSGTEPPPDPDALGHPRGTLAIVALYGLLLVVGWIAMYLAFLARGTPHS